MKTTYFVVIEWRDDQMLTETTYGRLSEALAHVVRLLNVQEDQLNCIFVEDNKGIVWFNTYKDLNGTWMTDTLVNDEES